jgi:hypothetical protein
MEVGDTIEVCGKKYLVVEDKKDKGRCNDCAFYNDKNLCENEAPFCINDDGIFVIFKEVKE